MAIKENTTNAFDIVSTVILICAWIMMLVGMIFDKVPASLTGIFMLAFVIWITKDE